MNEIRTRLLYFYLTFLFACGSLTLSATHQRAGEISYVSISGLTYEFTIITYTYTPSPADRPSLNIDWGDGSTSEVARTQKINLGNDISKNVYISQHTFSTSGMFHVTLEDPNRNAGIVNIPNSVEIPFFLETIVVINPFLGNNSSPQLLTDPVDNGCTNTIYYHNPGAYDPDGDSLSYSLIYCRGYNGEDIPGYSLPHASNSIAIDAVTGDLVWDCPTMVGEYNIAILITEWRSGKMIGSMVRDMQVSIAACNNRPPMIVTTDTCILAGTFIELPIHVEDATSTKVTLSATGEPFYLTESPARFNSITHFVPYFALLSWPTTCNHVRRHPYSVLFKARDNGPQVELVSFATAHITVVAPKPENLRAVPVGNTVHLSWQPDACTNATGYDIYRRHGSNPFEPDHCETGMPADANYEKIGTTTAWADTVFVDDGTAAPLYHANEYCYRVVARFADGAESYVSDEACTHIANDAPLIINTDVVTTDSLYGTVRVRWVRPPEIDSAAFPPPYYYILYRSPDHTNTMEPVTPVPLALTDSDTAEILDHDLDTRNSAYTYQVHFLSTDTLTLVEKSDKATTLNLQIEPVNHRLNLAWQVQQPWENVLYTIYRYEENGHLWDSIGSTPLTHYTDYPLVNGTPYCYYVEATGGYWLPDTIYPLYNRSQQKCSIPRDDDPPEMPALSITTDCSAVTYQWQFSSDSAAHDASIYRFYYKPTVRSDLVCIDSILNSNEDCYSAPCEYKFSGTDVIVGCFAMTIADSNGNITAMSDSTCFDAYECLNYRLPNVFTPNADGINDLFTPEIPYYGVTKVDMHLYNRWGKKVFQTCKPSILWDGTDNFSHRPCSEGVYYYSCQVYINTLTGEQSYPLHGSVTLIR